MSNADPNALLADLRALTHAPPSWPAWCAVWRRAQDAPDDPIAQRYAADQMARWPQRYHTWARLLAFRCSYLSPGSLRCDVIDRATVRQHLLPLRDPSPNDPEGAICYTSTQTVDDPERSATLPIIHALDSYLERFFARAFEHRPERLGPYAQPEPDQEHTGHFQGAFGALGQAPPSDDASNDDDDWWDSQGPFYWEPLDTSSAETTTQALETHLQRALRWSINNKWYKIPAPDGSIVRRAFSRDPDEARQIEAQEHTHRKEIAQLIALFLSDLDPATIRVFTATHPALTWTHTGPHDDDIARDEITVVADDEHFRAVWVNHHRLYG